MPSQRLRDSSSRKDGLAGRYSGPIVLVCLIVAALAPVALVRIPAMVDYPNHLARMYLIAADGGPGANPHYQIAWALFPNLAMDLIVPWLGRLTGVENAARLFLLLCQVLLIAGALSIERVVKGRVQLSGFAAVMFLYCVPFAWGFLNFEMALGIALCGIAAMFALEDRPWPLRLAVHAAFVAAIFAAHFFALGIYGVVLGLRELWRAWKLRAPYGAVALRLLLLAVPAVAVLAAMIGSGSTVGSPKSPWFWQFGGKLFWLTSILNGYYPLISWVTAPLLYGWLYLTARHGLLRFAPGGLWMTAGLAAFYVAIPAQLFGASFVDQRVIVAAAFILPAFLELSIAGRRLRLASLACIAAVILANLAAVYTVWLSYQATYAAVIASFGKLPNGALVLSAHSGEGEDPPMRHLVEYPIYHAPTLAVHYANAFVPDLFTGIGKQPVQPRAAVQRLDTPEGGPIPMDMLVAVTQDRTVADTPRFVRSWHRDFDYLYVLGPHRPNPLPDLLREEDRGRWFVLYKIVGPQARVR